MTTIVTTLHQQKKLKHNHTVPGTANGLQQWNTLIAGGQRYNNERNTEVSNTQSFSIASALQPAFKVIIIIVASDVPAVLFDAFRSTTGRPPPPYLYYYIAVSFNSSSSC